METGNSTSWILRGVGTFATLLLCTAAARAEPAPDESIAIETGAAYLAGKQVPVGGWPSEKYGLTSPGHVIAITTLAAHALLASAPGEDSRIAAAKALSFLDRLPAAIERGKTHDGYDYGSWGVAYALVHLGGIIDRWPAGEKPPDVSGPVARLTALSGARQRPCGGWDYRERPDGSLGVLTAVMLEGLVRWKADRGILERGFADLAKSAARLLSSTNRSARAALLERASVLVGEILAGQREDGSWLDSPAAGETCATSLALLTLTGYRELVVGWAPDPETALRWGKEEGKPVVFLFTEQNEASRKMSGYFYGPSFRALLPRFVPCRVDVDRDRATARSARVYRGPTILIADPTAEKPLADPVRKLIGSRSPGKLRYILETVLVD